MVRDEARLGARDAPGRVRAQHPELSQPRVRPDLPRDGQKAVVRHHEQRGAPAELVGRQGRDESLDEPVHVVDRPVGLRRARPVEVLEAVHAQEVDEQEPRCPAVPDVAREVGHHGVLQESFRQLRPLALAVERVAERRELGPDRARGLGLEHALVLEERQVEMERGRVARRGPVDRRGREPRGVGVVVDRGRAQEVRRVVNGIAREVLGRPRPSVEDAVADHAVPVRRHPRDEARVRRPGRAGEHGLHACGDDPALREGAEPRHPRRGVGPVERRQPVDADDDRLPRDHATTPRGGRVVARRAIATTFRSAESIHTRS